MKKNLICYFLLVIVMVAGLSGCKGKTETGASGDVEAVTIRVGAMSGPTAMGMVKLMSDSEEGNTENTYQFAELSTDAAAFVAPLTKGEIDIAAVPANLAANIYNSTEGKVKVVAVNTLGVLNLVERGDTVGGIADLAGKKIYATGQGAVPEYTIRYILKSNGINPDSDVDIRWSADTTEVLSYIKAEEGVVAILPQPFATAASAQVPDLRIVKDLNEAWDELETGCSIATGVIVVRTEFAEKYPKQLDRFIEEYENSVDYVLEDKAGAAALIVKYKIVGSEAVAEKAIEKCHIVCLTGEDCKAALEGFLQILYEQNPKSVGGKLPEEDFYYIR